jgi:hypothetical protein
LRRTGAKFFKHVAQESNATDREPSFKHLQSVHESSESDEDAMNVGEGEDEKDGRTSL